MRLSFYQVASDIIDQSAGDLAVLLRWRESDAGWGLVKLFKWALGRCPDELPPSMHDVVQGPDAARLIAHAAGFKGEPEAFVTACEQVHPPVLERLEKGIRIRGLDRYDQAWAKNHPAEWKALCGEAGPEPEEALPETGTEPDETGPETPRKTKKKTNTKKEEETTHTRSAGEPPPSALLEEQLELAPGPKPEQLQALWNELADPALQRWEAMPKKRLHAAKRRLRERPLEGPRGWRAVIERINDSPFLLGGGTSGWKADPDWLLKEGTGDVVLEGKYDGKPSAAAEKLRPQSPSCERCGSRDGYVASWWGNQLCTPCREAAPAVTSEAAAQGWLSVAHLVPPSSTGHLGASP